MPIDRGMDKEDVLWNAIMPFAVTWIDLEIIILSEVRQWNTDIIWYCSCVGSNLQKDTNELIYKIETHL